MFFNVFEAAPENERDGPNQQNAQNASGKVIPSRFIFLSLWLNYHSASRILPLITASRDTPDINNCLHVIVYTTMMALSLNAR